MATSNTKIPPIVHMAFNPAILEVTTDNLNEASPEFYINTSTSSFPVSNSIAVKKEFKDKKAVFNISDYVKDLFVDQVKTIQENVFIDYNLCVFYRQTKQPGNNDFIAVNGVAQLGESSDLSLQYQTFRTRLQRLSCYEGYPLTVTILGINEREPINLLPYYATPVKYNDEAVGDIRQPYFTVNIKPGKQYIALEASTDYMQSNDGGYIYTNDGELIQIPLGNDKVERRLLIDNKCIPQNPFYIRWINREGGWDYFMFSHRQQVKRNIKNQRTFCPTVWDQKTATAFEKSIYKDGEEKITVGADALSQDEFDSVSRMPYSPKIHYYDKQKKRWFDLIITDAESEEDTRNNSHSVEFGFLLPVPQMQF